MFRIFKLPKSEIVPKKTRIIFGPTQCHPDMAQWPSEPCGTADNTRIFDTLRLPEQRLQFHLSVFRHLSHPFVFLF